MAKKSQIINGTSGDDTLYGDINGTLIGQGGTRRSTALEATTSSTAIAPS